ncbi:MAG TPA: hypothetical protein VF661_10540 [Actinomycetales bacterium]
MAATGGGQATTAARSWFSPQVPLRRIAVLRTVIYLFVIVDVLKIGNDPIAHGDVPQELYRPIMLREWLHLPAPSPDYVRVLFVVLVASALVAAAGRLPRAAGLVCLLAFLDWMSNNYSYSKIDHDQFALVVALAVLPTAGPARWSDPDGLRTEAAGWSVRMMQVGVVCCYFLSAVAKMRFGGWGWANGAIFTWAFTRRGTGLTTFLLSVPGLVHLMQWVVLIAEFCSPALLFVRGRLLWFGLAFFVTFHLMTYLTIKIHFLPLVVCLVAFVPLERLVPRRLVRADDVPEPAQAA